MNAGFKYGLLLAVEMIVLLEIAPQPWGAVAFFAVQAVQLTAYTAVAWQRTGLLVSTVGGCAAALASVLFLVRVALGYSWRSLPTVWAVPVVFLAGLVPLSVLGEARIHPREWTELKRHMEGMGLWDVLLLRHIPRLRRRSP